MWALLDSVVHKQVSKELAVGHNGPTSPHQTTDPALALFPLLHQLLICPVFRVVAVSDALIADLSAYLAASASASTADLTGIAQFQVATMCCCTPAHLLKLLWVYPGHNDPVLQRLLVHLPHILPWHCCVLATARTCRTFVQW